MSPPGPGRPLRSVLLGCFLLAGVFYVNFTARLLLAPLLPLVEADLGLDHAQSGSLFLYLSIGYFTSLILSAFVSARLNHRRTIILSAFLLAAALAGMSLARSTLTLALSQVAVGLAGGLYLPSGLASLYDQVRPGDWGKALAVHELAPNTAFFITPLLATWILGLAPWPAVSGFVGAAALVMALAYLRWGQGGQSLGLAPDLGLLRELAGSPTMWLMLAVFALSVGSSIGAYTMLPLYLVAGHGLPQEQANAYLALSRLLSSATAFASGFLIDRLGAFTALRLFLLVSGLATLGLGLASGTGLLVFLFLQPHATVCLFPAAFAALARASEEKLRGLAVSLVVPPGILLGSGGVPTFIGWMGDLGLFGHGFTVLGVLALGLTLILRGQRGPTVYTRPAKP